MRRMDSFVSVWRGEQVGIIIILTYITVYLFYDFDSFHHSNCVVVVMERVLLLYRI